MRAQEHIQQSQFQPLVGVDPLQTTWLERGAVRSRVALLLRSSETQPLFNDLSSIDRTCPQASDQSPGATCSRGCLGCFHRLCSRAADSHHCSRAVALSRKDSPYLGTRARDGSSHPCPSSWSIHTAACFCPEMAAFASSSTRPTPSACSSCSMSCPRLTGPLHRPPIITGHGKLQRLLAGW